MSHNDKINKSNSLAFIVIILMPILIQIIIYLHDHPVLKILSCRFFLKQGKSINKLLVLKCIFVYLINHGIMRDFLFKKKNFNVCKL